MTKPSLARLSMLTLLIVACSIRCGGGDDENRAQTDGGKKDGGKKDGAAGIGDGSWSSDAKGGTGGMLGGDGWASGGGGNATCVLATHAYAPGNIEIATRFGKMWSYAGGVLLGGYPKDLTSVTHYASGAGPCVGKSSGACTFGTLGYNAAGNEVLTAYGQKWSYAGETLEAEFPKDLSAISRYADPGGPCEGKTALTCQLDTLTFDPAGAELVTVSGKIWSWSNGALDAGYPQDLTSVARYTDSSGPCTGKTAGNCHFDTMTYNASGAEVVTLNGMMWSFTGGVLDSGFPKSLSSIAYLSGNNAGPCI